MNEETVSTCGSLFDPLPVVWSRQEVLYPGGRNRLEHGPWVVGQGPEFGLELGPQLIRAPVPRPAHVQRELGERLDPDILDLAHERPLPGAPQRVSSSLLALRSGTSFRRELGCRDTGKRYASDARVLR